MFKYIMIHLTGPICKCEWQNLKWSINVTEKGNGLKIWCVTCNTAATIPHEQFIAGFRFEKEYPKGPIFLSKDITKEDLDFLKQHDIKFKDETQNPG